MLFSLVLTIPQAEAKFFDIFEKFLGRNEEASAADSISSQTLAILSAPLSSNLFNGIGGGDISTVQDSAVLPMTGPLGSMADIESQRSDAISLYVVRGGDSLSGIANLFGVTTNTIRLANNLKGGLISPGQILIILPVSGVQYTVKKGDTIQGIAKKFNGDVSEILSFNDMGQGVALAEGAVLIIPNGEAVVNEVPGKPLQKTSPPKPSYKGYYARPIAGGIRTQGIHGYNGVDLASACGAPILASAAGDVLIAKTSGWNSGYGEYVVVSHPNGTQTLYAHLKLVLVGPGWHVEQGQLLGYMGSTGLSTGCHVHFEVRGARNPF